MENLYNHKSFVQNLVTEGKSIPCDDTSRKFKENMNVPSFYNEEFFKKGQQFYHNNIFAMFLAKFSGLVAILSIPTIRNILIYTKMSSTPMSSYRRYLSTLFHMHVWYKTDFKPGTDLWKSILEVRNKHNSASNRHCKAGNHRISQFDMAVTQFGFMGFVMVRPKMVGVHSYTNDELEGFIHLWRVIGDIMGIEERFNICRGTVEETKAICEELLQTVLKPEIEKLEPSFIEMSDHLVSGLWCMQPMLQINVFMSYILSLLGNNKQNSQDNNNQNEKNEVVDYKLTKAQSFHLWFILSVISTMRFHILKLYHNYVMYLSLWLMENFPFLAYYKFGKANSHVTILNNNSKNVC